MAKTASGQTSKCQKLSTRWKRMNHIVSKASNTSLETPLQSIYSLETKRGSKKHLQHRRHEIFIKCDEFWKRRHSFKEIPDSMTLKMDGEGPLLPLVVGSAPTHRRYYMFFSDSKNRFEQNTPIPCGGGGETLLNKQKHEESFESSRKFLPKYHELKKTWSSHQPPLSIPISIHFDPLHLRIKIPL